MAQLLQGGTWLAGRTIAARLRPPDGPPPIAVKADVVHAAEIGRDGAIPEPGSTECPHR